jgi:hypothetical protein
MVGKIGPVDHEKVEILLGRHGDRILTLELAGRVKAKNADE